MKSKGRNLLPIKLNMPLKLYKISTNDPMVENSKEP